MIALVHPHLLWALLPALLYLLIVAQRSYVEAPLWRRVASALLRALVIACFLVAVAQPHLERTTETRNLLFLLDVSESVSAANKEAALARMRALAAKAPARVEMALLAFARERNLVRSWSHTVADLQPEERAHLLYEAERDRLQQEARTLSAAAADATPARLQALEAQRQALQAWQKQFGTDETDLEQALQLARALFPPDAQKRILLFSDGNENLGDSRAGIDALQREGVAVYTHLLPHAQTPEMMLTRIDAPAAVRIKEPFDLEVHLESNVEAPAELTLFLDDYKYESRTLDLHRGSAVAAFKRLNLEGGLHKFEAILEPRAPAQDTLAHNNRVNGFTGVRGKPRVLYIHGDGPEDEMQSHWLRDALEEDGITFGEDGVRPSSGIPEDLEGFLNFDIVIFENVPATRLTAPQMQNLKDYVQIFGGGFIMIGGEESFGLGGYYKTPVEEILPVRMPIEKDLEKTNLALVLVIDKSGSMSGAKVELAKESAIATAEVLQPRDQIGVVAFDHEARWIVEMTGASDMSRITSGIASLEAGGGTNIEPGMKLARAAIQDVSARSKLLIILSDGQTEGQGYPQLSAAMAADGVTISTVGIGEDADQRLLAEMADAGGGKFYFTNDFFSLPRIFTKETMRVSKSMLIEEPIQPLRRDDDQAIRGIDEFPLIHGYVATTPKAGAKMILLSDAYGDPLLATWRYGLGITAAFTSSTHSKWVPDWQNGDEWPYFTKFWGQLARSVMSVGTHKKVQVEVQTELRHREAQLNLDLFRSDGAFVNDLEKTCKLFLPDASAAEGIAQPLEHVGPGRYETRFRLQRFGAYHRLLLDQPTHELRQVFAFNQPYSLEYRDLAARPATLEAIATATGGVADAPDEEILRFPPPPTHRRPVWHWFLIAGLLLLPFDILAKRVLALE